MGLDGGVLLPSAVALPFAAALAVLFFNERRKLFREAATFVAALATFYINLQLAKGVLQGENIHVRLLSLSEHWPLALYADELGAVFALLSSFLWLVTSLYNLGYVRHGALEHRSAYWAAFAVCLGAAEGIAYAQNFLTFLVFYEILTVATYPLVVHYRTPQALAAGRKYLVYTLSAGQALLVGAVWLSWRAPGEAFTPGGFLNHLAPQETLALFFLLFAGVAVKASVMPLHAWLPAAMEAPTPVSGLLHAVAVVKAGVFGVLRLCGFVFGVESLERCGAAQIVLFFAALTILLASLRALVEPNLKRRLAYSTISQLSYIVLGAVCGSVAAFFGAVFHMAAHGFMKITLFFAAGSSYLKSHETEIPKLEGLGRLQPITFSAFAVAALGLAGTPFWVGFISKWNLAWGAWEKSHFAAVGVLVLSALFNLAYFFPILKTAFFPKKPLPWRMQEVSWTLWLPLSLTAFLSVVLGVQPDAFFSFLTLARRAAEKAVAGGLL